MRLKAIPATLLSLLIVLVACGANARADDDTEPEYEVTARVARISLIKGDATIKRQGNTEWEKAKLNLALVEGDTLATAADSRVEIQIDARNFARVGPDSLLTIVTLRNEGIALSLSRGTAAVRLARFDRDREYFEIDAPKTTVAAEKTGLYRLDVDPNGRVQITVRDDGRARIYSPTSGFLVRSGHSATLVHLGDAEGDWQFAAAPATDSWDDWVTSREAYLATRLRYDDRVRYYDSDVWGAEELDAYGDWSYVNDYGWIWRPHVTVINNYNNWAPYRYGEWVWCPPYGWTWVGQEPWGWAPYHYGRWVYYNNYWAWCPRSFNQRRSWWRPALVAFVSLDFNFGSNYCWYPLSYHQRDPRSRHYGRDRDRFRAMRPDELARLRRVDPAFYRAVSSQSARDFGSRAARSQAVAADIARRAVGLDPLTGDLPVRPAGVVDRNNRGVGERQTRAAIVRPPANAVLAERPTGAASRRPGVALDNELRRTRVFNGRDPVPVNPGSNGGSFEGVTGAVTRPARPARANGGGDNPGTPGTGGSIDRPVRPAPVVRDNGNDGHPIDTTPDLPARPAREPNSRARDNNGSPADSSPVERTARPAREREVERNVDETPRSQPRDESSRPARPERSEAPVRSDPVTPPPQRSEPPAPRYEPPARHDPPPQRSEPPAPRYEPPARHDPPPQRSEPPAPRYEPPPRNDPPPQRSEPAPRNDPPPQRSEPPARSEPAPQRSEPAKPSEERPSRAERKRDNRN